MTKFSNFLQTYYGKEEVTKTPFYMHVYFLFENPSKSKIIIENVFFKMLIHKN